MDGARIFRATQPALRFVLRDHVPGNYSAAGDTSKVDGWAHVLWLPVHTKWWTCVPLWTLVLGSIHGTTQSTNPHETCQLLLRVRYRHPLSSFFFLLLCWL